MRELGLLLLLITLALTQATLLPAILGTPPALVLIVVVCCTLVSGLGASARWAFYGGVAIDLCAAAPIGSHALALLLAALAVHVALRRLGGEHWLLPVVATFGAALLYETVLALIYTLPVAPLDWRNYAVVALLPSALMAMVPALPVYALLRQFERWRREAALEM
ncbi:MAG: rod shape-determining protein MreD [Chloroflexales bacterium]|nr:rod shape-determining protein MreD [Chloroflexales bacterium]